MYPLIWVWPWDGQVHTSVCGLFHVYADVLDAGRDLHRNDCQSDIIRILNMGNTENAFQIAEGRQDV